MAGRLTQMRTVAQQALNTAYATGSSSAGKWVAETMKNNKEYIVKDPAAAAKLPKQLAFTTADRVLARWEVAKTEWGSWSGKFKNYQDLSLVEALTGVAFVTEVYAWFAVGEVVGRGFRVGSYMG